MSNPYQKSLAISWQEGIPAAVMLAVMDNYLIPLGLFLGASPKQIGLLVAFPNLLSSIVLLFAIHAVKRAGSQLRFLIFATLLQALILIPVCFLPLMPSGALAISFLILLITIFRMTGNLISTVWQSLISHYLPPEGRGNYFGWRSQVSTLASVLGVAGGGLLLYFFDRSGSSKKLGFILLFVSATVCRLISSYLMSKMEDVTIPHDRTHDFTFWMFIMRIRESNFVKFVLFVASISLTTNLASPYFNVYILKELNFSYLQYMIVMLLTTLVGWIAFPIWGRHADHVGNAKILHITSLLIPLVPFLWLFSKNFYYLIAVEIYAGFIWAGFNLCSVNFIFDAVTPGKRTRCLSYFNLINGAAIFIGASLGGFLAEHLPPLWGSRFYSLFALSTLLRFISHSFLSGKFQEVRKTHRKISSLDLFFSVAGIKPILGRNEGAQNISWMKRK
ncbi:MAG: MFS transporter [Candidatus Omnitrophica bacterium]|nr:MFS transporter [Candidatus Omnitrophota bacterium]